MARALIRVHGSGAIAFAEGKQKFFEEVQQNKDFAALWPEVVEAIRAVLSRQATASASISKEPQE